MTTRRSKGLYFSLREALLLVERLYFSWN